MNFLFWKSAPKPSADSKSSSKDSGSKSPLTRIAQIVVQRHILPCLAVNDIIFSLIRVNRATTQLLCISCSDTWRVWVYERFTAQTISRFLQQSGGLILPLDFKSAIANAPSSAAAKSNTSPPPNEWHVVNKSILASSFAVDHGGCGAGKLLLTAAKSSDQAAGFWYRMFYSIRRFQLMESRHRSSRPASSKKGNLVAKLIVIGNAGVGKTSLISRCVQNRFGPDYYKCNIACDFMTRQFAIEPRGGQSKSKTSAGSGGGGDGSIDRVTLQMWDTSGAERFNALSTAYYRRADVILLCFDAAASKPPKPLKWDRYNNTIESKWYGPRMEPWCPAALPILRAQNGGSSSDSNKPPLHNAMSMGWIESFEAFLDSAEMNNGCGSPGGGGGIDAVVVVVGCKIDELSEPPSSEHRAWALPYLTGGVQHQQQSSSKDSKDSKQHHPPLIDRNATNPISGRSSTSSIDSAVDNWDALRHLKWWADSHGFHFELTSAKSSQNVMSMFQRCCERAADWNAVATDIEPIFVPNCYPGVNKPTADNSWCTIQ